MPSFALRTIQSVNGNQIFQELIVDDVRPMKRLGNRVKSLNNKALTTELGSIFSRMDLVSNGVDLPDSKFKRLRNPTRGIDEYEFKTHSIRVYCFKIPNGKLVVWGGFKSEQDSDIKHFRFLKNQYLDHLEHEKRRIAQN